MRLLRLAPVLLACQLLSGCIGLIYTHVTEPLTPDLMAAAPVVSESSRGDVKTIQYYVQVQWDKNGIGQIAKKYGFDEIYYADLETLRVLGIWTQQWVHVYGSRKTSEPMASSTGDPVRQGRP